MCSLFVWLDRNTWQLYQLFKTDHLSVCTWALPDLCVCVRFVFIKNESCASPLIISLLQMYQFRCVTPFTWILPCVSTNQFQMYSDCSICRDPLTVLIAVIGRKGYIPRAVTAEDNVTCSFVTGLHRHHFSQQTPRITSIIKYLNFSDAWLKE